MGHAALPQPGEHRAPAAIYDTNGAIVAAAINENGGEAIFLGAIPDDEEKLEAAMRKALFLASSLGSFCVEGVGPSRLLNVTRSDLAARMAAFARLIDVGGDLTLDA